jgi:hypothetical protein
MLLLGCTSNSSFSLLPDCKGQGVAILVLDGRLASLEFLIDSVPLAFRPSYKVLKPSLKEVTGLCWGWRRRDDLLLSSSELRTSAERESDPGSNVTSRRLRDSENSTNRVSCKFNGGGDLSGDEPRMDKEGVGGVESASDGSLEVAKLGQ